MSITQTARLTAIACSATLAMNAWPHRAAANPAAIPAVTACAASVYCAIGVAVVGGVTYWTLTHNNQQPILVPLQPMVVDPEEPIEEWDEGILADSPEQAARKCRALAKGYGLDLISVKRPSKIKKGQSQRYECKFRTRTH